VGPWDPLCLLNKPTRDHRTARQARIHAKHRMLNRERVSGVGVNNEIDMLRYDDVGWEEEGEKKTEKTLQRIEETEKQSDACMV
jgi:hypothetical protein